MVCGECIVKSALPRPFALRNSCLPFFVCVGRGIRVEIGGPTAQMLGNM